MALLPLFSRRKRQAEQSDTDIYAYDKIPANVRVQILMNIENMFKVVEDYANPIKDIYGEIVKELREEIGTYELTSKYCQTKQDEFEIWFVESATTDQALDGIELAVIMARHLSRNTPKERERCEEYWSRINARFQEASIGYEISGNQIIQKTNDFAHSQVVTPALHLLSESRFATANAEFREAHRAYRAQEYEDCLVDCLKSLESVIKVIASERGWQLPEHANAKKLISALFENELVPTFMRSQFDGLRALLESSVPTTRNRVAGHGQGAEPRSVPASLAALQLHQTASIIIFLAALD